MSIYKIPTIIFDQQIFKSQRYGGISRYFSNLINGLTNSKHFHVLPHQYFSNNCHLEAQQLDMLSLIYKIGNFRGKGRLMNYIDSKKTAEIKQIIKEGKFDIFHPTYYDDNFLDYFPINKPFVLTVHDMIHELYFDDYFKTIHPETSQKSNLIPKAEHIIAISEYTKNDILALYPQVNPAKITVIHHGYSLPGKFIKKNMLKLPRYILYVGARQYYKNFNWMLGSIANFLLEQSIILVCAGGGNFNDSEIELINEYKLHSKVRFYDIPNDQVLNGLYSDAFCFVFPSLFEGFGLPILEAFANMCPVILSNLSCFPEIAGNAALYFEVNKLGGLVMQLSALMYEKGLRTNLINAGKERLENFGWPKMVNEHEKIYTSICGL